MHLPPATPTRVELKSIEAHMIKYSIKQYVDLFLAAKQVAEKSFIFQKRRTIIMF